MPFIGKQPQTGAYSKLDAITTSATATYNLTLDGSAYFPQSANHLLVSLNGVMQAPQDSFTISGSQITFASALTSSDSIDFIMALGDTLDIGVPSDGSVVTGKLANDAVTVAKVVDQISTGGKSNLFINGKFEIFQRGAGPASPSAGNSVATADRWNIPNTGETTEVVDNDRDSSLSKMFKVTANSSGYGQIAQWIEDARTAAGKTITVSFWAKSPETGTFRFHIYQNFGSGGSTSVSVIDDVDYFTISQANTWERFEASVSIPSVSGKTIGDGSYLAIQWGAQGGSASRIMYYSEAQAEIGSEASPFEHRPYGEELALCQRYTVVYNYDTFANSLVFPGIARAGTTKFFHITLPQSMRDATPSLSLTGEIRILSQSTNEYKDATDTLTVGGVAPSINTSGHGLTLYYSGTITDITNTQNAMYQMMFVGDTGHQLVIDGEL